jgi:membrane protein
MKGIWQILRAAVSGYLAHDALSRGAAIAFYSVTSLAPVLFIVIAIAGLVFGQDAVRGSIVRELSGLLGNQSADLLQSLIARSSDPKSGVAATTTGLIMVLVTASGVFSEMHSALNATWEVEPSKEGGVFSLVRARAASLGLVAALGFLLMVSLAASAAIAAFGHYLQGVLPFATLVLSILNTVVSLALFTVLFSAIYKVLPDTPIGWRDVLTGGFLTALLFTIGKSLIGWYLGRAAPSSGYGAAGSLIVLLLWIYYSAQIFLFGAELTKATADYRHPRKETVESDQVLRRRRAF